MNIQIVNEELQKKARRGKDDIDDLCQSLIHHGISTGHATTWEELARECVDNLIERGKEKARRSGLQDLTHKGG